MKFLPTVLALGPLAYGLAAGSPTINLEDPRFMDYQPPGPGDSRSPCPALNALANHGFLPHNGRNVNLLQLIAGLFFGLGVSPEVSGVIGAIGLVSSHNPLTIGFDLEDLRKHMFLIEHDCSFSREDSLVGDNNDFNPALWDVVLAQINGSETVTPLDLGRAKGVRVEDEKKRNPKTVYGPRAAAFGALEAGLVLSALGAPIPGISRLDYIRSFFEEERLPAHLGWKPIPLIDNTATATVNAVASFAGDPYILEHAVNVILGTPSDILQTIVPPQFDPFAELADMIASLGFDPKSLDSMKSLLGK